VAGEAGSVIAGYGQTQSVKELHVNEKNQICSHLRINNKCRFPLLKKNKKFALHSGKINKCRFLLKNKICSPLRKNK
jgi:hypothetical protein